MQVILDSSFVRPGSASMWGGKKGDFRNWTRQPKSEKNYNAKNYNARAQLLFCSLNLLFSDVVAAVAVVDFLSSLISAGKESSRPSASETLEKVRGFPCCYFVKLNYFVKSQRGSGFRCINKEQKSCCNIPAGKKKVFLRLFAIYKTFLFTFRFAVQ